MKSRRGVLSADVADYADVQKEIIRIFISELLTSASSATSADNISFLSGVFLLKIGVFDSGLGGLLIARSIIHEVPDHDCLYVGDTERVPYGTRSKDTIYQFTHQAVDFLFRHESAS